MYKKVSLKYDLKNQISKNALMWTINTESQLCQNSSAADLVILDGSIHSKISKIKTVFSNTKALSRIFKNNVSWRKYCFYFSNASFGNNI